MKKFKDKKVVRAQAGAALGQGSKPEEVPQWLRNFFAPGVAATSAYNTLVEGLKKSYAASGSPSITVASDQALPIRSGVVSAPPASVASANVSASKSGSSAATPSLRGTPSRKTARTVPPALPVPASPTSGAASAPDFSGYPQYDYLTEKNAMEGYRNQDLSALFRNAAKAPGASPALAKAAEEIPKTKSGLKKFMQDYGQFIALGALAGQGGKGGQIAAPIIAALPGLIAMMKKKKSGSTPAATPDKAQVSMARGGFMKKSSGGETPKKSEGGAIRKFKGGSMKGNTKDSMLTPKYAKDGKMIGKMGKAEGEMPQHKKMAMGKPTPQSTGAKFAKGGAAKYASGGMCKGYGISKKVRPTGPMN